MGWFAYRHTVFLCKVGRVHFVAVGNHGLVCHLLLRCVIDGIIPFEAQSLDWEAVLYHAWDKLVVHDVAQHGAVAFNQVLEHLEVCF